MATLFENVKTNLMIEHEADDEVIYGFVIAALSYAESYQHRENGYYLEHDISPTTKQAVIMLASHFYESRDGSTGGFYNDNVSAAQQVWKTVNLLLQLERRWKL
jgi:uncharacterized phage protein (possible DNA packaging)